MGQVKEQEIEKKTEEEMGRLCVRFLLNSVLVYKMCYTSELRETHVIFCAKLCWENSILTLRKRLRICSVISVNYHYITVLCPFSLLIRFKCYTTV